MNHMLPQPGFWALTAREMKTRSSMLGEMLILVLLHLIASIVGSFLLTIPLTAWVMGSESGSILEAAREGRSMYSVLDELLRNLPDWAVIVA